MSAGRDTPIGIDVGPGGVPGRVRIQDGPLAGLGENGGGRRELGVESVFEAREVSVYYGRKRALAAVNLKIPRSRITALIGPSGCGKTTFLRSLNRMNDPVPGFRIEG